MSQQHTIDGIDFSQPDDTQVLPPRSFTSPVVYERELEDIFGRSWVHVADTTDLKQPGDFVAAHIGTTPVVVMRAEDGEIRTFLNACRHRGAQLASGTGNCGRSLNCPYHAWAYAPDGRLLGVPEREEFSFDPDKMGLVPVRTGVAVPFVFACLDAEAPSFEVWAEHLIPVLAASNGDQAQFLFEYSYDVNVNWKVYVENGLDGYHVPFVHDMLDDFVETKTAYQHFSEYGSYTHAFIKPEYVEMSPPTPHLTRDGRMYTYFGHVFPNIIPVISPIDISYLRIDPVGPEKIRLVSRAFSRDPNEEMVNYLRESFDRTNQQDIAAVEMVQKGLRARGLPAGYHAAFLESRIGHFGKLVRRALVGDAGEKLARSGSLTAADAVRAVA